MKLTATLQDTHRLAARMQALSKDIEAQALAALAEGAQAVADTARSLAPKRTGELQSSIRVVEGDDGVTVEATAPHAAFVEFGTLKQPARPFLAPALAACRPAIVERVARAVRAAIAKGRA